MANIPSLIDMSDDEIEIHLRGHAGLAATSTPAHEATRPINPYRQFCRVDQVAEFCQSSAPPARSDDDRRCDYEARLMAANSERHAVEAQLRALQHRYQETEEALFEERGRRKSCQELLEKSAILNGAQGPGREDPAGPGREAPAGPVPERPDPLVTWEPGSQPATTMATPAQPRRVAATLKLGKYDGTTSLDTFLAKVTNCREYYEWSEKDTVHQLRASLEGSAGQVLWECGSSFVSLDSMITLLRNRFGNQNQTERFRAELHARRRAKGESLQAVYQDIRRLVALAFPGQSGSAPGSVYEVLARDAFLTAIDNPSIRRRVLERDPPPDTLDAALSAAVRLEALDSAEATLASA